MKRLMGTKLNYSKKMTTAFLGLHLAIFQSWTGADVALYAALSMNRKMSRTCFLPHGRRGCPASTAIAAVRYNRPKAYISNDCHGHINHVAPK